MQSIAKKHRRGISILLIIALLLSLGTVPAMAMAGVTNQTVSNALDNMTASGAIPSDVNKVHYLDFTNNTSIMGEVDIAELKAIYPNLVAVYLDGTNVQNVINIPAVTGEVTYSNTLFSGKTIAYGGTPVIYRDGDGDLAVSKLLAAAKVIEANGNMIDIPAGLLGTSGNVIIESNTIPVTSDGVIAEAVLKAMAAGEYTVTLDFPYTGSTARASIPVKLIIKRESFTLSPSLDTVYGGGTVSFTLKKSDEDGNSAVIGDPSEYDISYSGSGVSVSAQKISDYSIKIDTTAGDSSAQSGWLIVKRGGVEVAKAQLIVAQNANINGFNLVEINSGNISNDPGNNTIYVVGGTSISSFDYQNLTDKKYTSATKYLLRNQESGEYIPERYRSQITVAVNNIYSLNADVVPIDDPNGGKEKVLALSVTSGISEYVDCGPNAVTVSLKNSDGTIVTIGTGVISIPAIEPLGYEIYSIPGASSGKYDSFSRADIEAAIKENNPDFRLAARYVKDGAVYKNNGEGEGVIITEGDSVYLIAAAYYEAGGDKFVLSKESVNGWYDTTVLADHLFDASGHSIGSTNISGKLSTLPMNDYSNVLQLEANAGSSGNTAEAIISIKGAAANLTVGVRVEEAFIKEYIFVPSGYTLSSGTYKKALEKEKEEFANSGTAGPLYKLNVLRETELAIGTSTEIKVVGVYSNNSGRETGIADWTNPVADIAGIGDAGLVEVKPGLNNEQLNLSATAQGGVNDAKAGASTTLTVTDAKGVSATLKIVLTASKIVGVHAILQDIGGNFYSNSDAMAAYADVEKLNGTFQIPKGTKANLYVVYAFSNSEFYDTSAGDGWKNYLASPANVEYSVNAAGYVTVDVDGDHFVLNGNIVVGDTGLLVKLKNTATPPTINGKTYEYDTAPTTFTWTPRISVAVTEPLVVAAEAENVTNGLNVPIANGGAVSGNVGNTLEFKINANLSDGQPLSATTANPITGLSLKISKADGSPATDIATASDYQVLLQKKEVGIKAWIEYTYTVNGKTTTLVMNDFAGTGKYGFNININSETAEQVYLVATGDKLQEAGAGAYALTYAFNERYRIYPVIADSSYTLCGYTSLPTDITYGDAVAKSCFKFMPAKAFNTESAWATTGMNGLALATLKTDENGYAYYDMTAIGMNDGATPYKVTFDPTKVNVTSSDYGAYNAVTAADVDIYHRQTSENTNVVDIVPTEIRSRIDFGEVATWEIKYSVSTEVSGTGNTTIVSPGYFGASVMPGTVGYNPDAKNALRVETISKPEGSSYVLSSTGDYLQILPDQPGSYKLKVYTINNAGVRAPYFGDQYRIVTVDVNPIAETQTVRYGETVGLNILNRLHGWKTITEIGATSLDASALAVGALKMVSNADGTTTVNVFNSNGDVMGKVTVNMVSATISNVSLSRATSVVNKVNFAPGESIPLVWKVKYIFAGSADTVTAYEPIDSANWTLDQSDNIGATLTLSGNTITASGNTSGRMVYKAVYPANGYVEYFWGYLDANATIPTYSYTLSKSNTSIDPVTSLTMRPSDAVQTLYVWNNATSQLITGLNVVLSDNPSVVNATAVSANAVDIKPVAVGNTTINIYPDEGGAIAIPVTVLIAEQATFTVSGGVSNGSTAIAGANITITGGSGGVYTAVSAADGSFSVSGIPNGTYNITISASGYVAYGGTVTVNNANVPLGIITLTTPSGPMPAVYDVTGTVTGKGAPLAGATATIKGNAGTFAAATDGNGNFVLSGIPDGTYTLTVTANGYDANSQQITVSGGNLAVPAITMTPSSGGGGGTPPGGGGGGSGGGSGGGGGGGGGSSTGTKYAISTESSTNGSVKTDASSAAAGTVVTITVKPDAGYELDTITVKGKSEKVKTSKQSNGEYTFKMPGESVTVSATFKKAGDGQTAQPTGFVDVNSGDWFYEYVNYVAGKGYMNGVESTVFAPYGELSRGMMTRILYNMEGKPTVSAPSSYTDVKADEWYADAIAWGTSVGVVKGYGEGKFGPNDNVTREQMAAMLYRYASYKGKDVSKTTSLTGFIDAANVGEWAVPAMQWAVGNNLINGTTQTELTPQGTATRAQVATIITRYTKNL